MIRYFEIVLNSPFDSLKSTYIGRISRPRSYLLTKYSQRIAI